MIIETKYNIKTVGTVSTVEAAAELASRAKFNIKHYRTFAKSHDVEED